MIRLKILSRGCRFLYLAAIAIPVLSFGGTAIMSLSVSNIAMAVTAVIVRVVNGPPSANVKSLYFAALALLVILLAWIGLQVATPSFLPRAAAWEGLSLLDLPGVGPISIEPADSIAGVGYLTLPFLAFLTGLLLSDSDGDARWLTRWLGYLGAGIASLGLLQFVYAPGMLLFADKLSYKDSLTASFINRNSAATFLGLTAVVMMRASIAGVSGVMESLRERPTGTRRETPTKAPLGTGVLLMLTVVILTALLLTKSRAGIGSSLLAIAVLLILMVIFAPAKKRSAFATYGQSGQAKRLLRITGVVMSLILLTIFLGGRFLMRAEAQGTDDARFCVLPGVLQMWRDNRWFGTGFATFKNAFPAYRDPRCGMVGVWDKAHNFYLEIGTSMGLFPLILTIGAVIALASIYIRGIRRRKSVRTHCMVGLAALTLVSAHSFFDFSMQIPGVATFAAAVFSATSALALGQRAMSKMPFPGESHAQPSRQRRCKTSARVDNITSSG